jgi:integrase/recombinase XerD
LSLISFTSKEQEQQSQQQGSLQPLFIDRRIEEVTAGLRQGYTKNLYSISVQNALSIADYILALKTEVNLSDHYRRDLIYLLTTLSKYYDNKSFKGITRNDIIKFLEGFRRHEATDPMHRWIGTYNTYRMHLVRFFKWLYYPDIEPDKRPKPEVIDNIPQLRRKEKSIYIPTDLWTPEEDLLFLKYCPSKRMKCYHAIARDLGCRPHEILKLRIKDIAFKSVGNRQYAEVLVNSGKTGTRSLPLIDSLPYVKDYLNHEHPQPGNPNAVFMAAIGRSLGRQLQIVSLYKIYEHYKKVLFPKLLESPNITPEDKPKIKQLLKKPWNPYLSGRHTSLTQKSRILKESTLRLFAGWTINSDMPRRYIHLFGNAACEDILQAYGLVEKDSQTFNGLQGKQCPNCSEPNKPDSKFCAKCRMVLTYDAYSETIEETQKKESEVKELKEKYEQDMNAIRYEMNQQFAQVMSLIRQNPQLAQIKPEALTRKKLEE